jgi:FKBP-type peptidyl-prolyl cis-trans isomerase (trigger factor)
MKSFITLSLGALAAVGSAGELEIEKTFVPAKCDRKTKPGSRVKMHYTGRIDRSSTAGEKGKKFDSSLDRNEPFEFSLGQGQVIKGWDEGLLDMCEGEKRTLIIPPEMGYGDAGAGNDIPGGATLNFKVECISVEKEEPQENLFEQIDSNGDLKLTMDELKEWFKKERDQDEVPTQLWESENKNGDDHIDWDEFSGPKGENPEL